jgi:predicted dehydrogenase
MTSGGTLLSFHASRIGMTFETLQIIGDGGMLYFSGKDPAKLGVQLKDKNGGYTSPYEYKDVPTEFCGREGHIGLVTDFVAAITRGAPSERTVERGLYVQHIIETVVKSAEQGKTLVVD